MERVHIVSADQRCHDAVIERCLMQVVIIKRKSVIQATQFGPGGIDDVIMPQENGHTEFSQVDVIQLAVSRFAQMGKIHSADIHKPAKQMPRQREAPRRDEQRGRISRVGERSYGGG
jgi:hypothetical protein